jgi:hypothetical protein
MELVDGTPVAPVDAPRKLGSPRPNAADRASQVSGGRSARDVSAGADRARAVVCTLRAGPDEVVGTGGSVGGSARLPA